MFDDITKEIIFTKRKKTISISVEYKKIRVLAPKYTSKKFIDTLIMKRKSWIEQKLEEKNTAITITKKQYIEGERFVFMGKDIYLSCVEKEGESVSYKCINNISYIEIAYPPHISQSDEEQRIQYFHEKLLHWYKQQAYNILKKQTLYYADILEVVPHEIDVKNYKARWGCCSTRNEVFYNWKIIMAPIEIIDYIVIHELCHILEHNHSNRFWGHVMRLDIDYKQHRAWLHKNGYTLNF